MAMAVLLQAYAGACDAEAVELTVVDLRWQLVLDCLGAEEPAFSQGALHDFRARLIRTDTVRPHDDDPSVASLVGLASAGEGQRTYDVAALPERGGLAHASRVRRRHGRHRSAKSCIEGSRSWSS